MPSRRIILLFIAVLAMLGASSAQGQSGARIRTVASRTTMVRTGSAQTPAIRLPAPLPYVEEPMRPLKGVFLGTPLTRRLPRLVFPAGDKVLGSAGLVWSQRALSGTIEIRLLLF